MPPRSRADGRPRGRFALVLGLGLATALAQPALAKTPLLRVVRPLESMVYIPGGWFLMGAARDEQNASIAVCKAELGPEHGKVCELDLLFSNERPQKRVYVSPFYLDRTEVTVPAYRACVQAGACAPEPLLEPDERLREAPEGAAPLPISSVLWDEAERYCAWRGARLPSEAEWERAARGEGAGARIWPWGQLPSPKLSNHGRFIRDGELDSSQFLVIRPDASDGFAFTAPVGSYPGGASREGVLDLSGNVMEWTSDVFHDEPPQTTSIINPRGPVSGPGHTLRGGSWHQPRFYSRTIARENGATDNRSPEVGFRCAK